jgi:hypothetical protein
MGSILMVTDHPFLNQVRRNFQARLMVMYSVTHVSQITLIIDEIVKMLLRVSQHFVKGRILADSLCFGHMV